MPLSNVFISSRMEELAFERRSVFDALYLSGFTPLAFETEPTGESEKDMIDSLVDSSHLFVGIYYETIGSPQRSLRGLEPISYELYRFLLQHSHEGVRELAEAGRHSESKAVLDSLVGSKKTIKELRARISRGALNDVFSGRVRLFQMTHSYDAPMSRRLTDFLLPVHQAQALYEDGDQRFLHSFQAAQEGVSGPVVAGAKKCVRYLTARFQLFSLINRVIEEAETKGLKIPDPIHADNSDDWPHFGWRVSGQDQPGVLFVVLDAIFRQRFNVAMVCSGEPLDSEQVD